MGRVRWVKLPSNEIAEPLTGRSIEFYLFPLSWSELSGLYSMDERRRLLARRLVYGMYPEVVRHEENAARNLKSLASSYAYKDVLEYQTIRHPEALEKLLQALALQIGNEVSYNELASLVGLNKITVANYIQILEKAFIIFRLRPLTRNARNELKKLRKIYFYDTGVRNALINNLNPLALRQDVGSLWENFVISERMKRHANHLTNVHTYFWRSHDGQEVDYVEEAQGSIRGFEVKWGKKPLKAPAAFQKLYPHSAVTLINQDTFEDFVKNLD